MSAPSWIHVGPLAVLVASHSVTVREYQFFVSATKRTWSGTSPSEPYGDDLHRFLPFDGWDKPAPDCDCEAFCAWMFERDSHPCEACGGSGADVPPGTNGPEGPDITRAFECDACHGAGRVVGVECPECEASGWAMGIEPPPGAEPLSCGACGPISPIRNSGMLAILRYRQATKAEVVAAQRPCGCAGFGIPHASNEPICDACKGRSYTGPEYVEGGLVLAGELA